MPSMTSLFFGLIMGGTPGYEWGSWRVIMPIVLGVVGWAVFHVHQASRFCAEPIMPPRIFKKSTAVMAFIIIFLASIIVQAVSTFLPIYFQAVKDATGELFLAVALQDDHQRRFWAFWTCARNGGENLCRGCYGRIEESWSLHGGLSAKHAA
ncbi:MFS efflux transporter aclA [Metarhizium anisopliae]